MALQGFPGSKRILLGPSQNWQSNTPTATSTTLDAANEAIIMIGRVETSDGGSHTIDTSGSSSIAWRTGTTTFANGSTIVKVGIAPALTTAGPPARASNASDVISYDVNASFTGGGGGITTGAWQTSVPTAGTKTIAYGDLVAICIQMTARGGADSVTAVTHTGSHTMHRPTVTSFTGGSYAAVGGVLPNAFITFADGATGWLVGGNIASTVNTRTFNSGDATKEYGQLYQLPFPMKIYGLYGWVDPDADTDAVLYSDPLGTPVSEKTVSIDASVTASASGRYFEEWFTSPYTTTASQVIAAAYKPGGSNISTYYKTLGNAGHRVSDPWGTSGYGVSRAAAAFSDANSSLDHYYIGLIVGAFDDAAGAGGRVSLVNETTLVA